ncbi:hypothetical protein StoSoilB19_34000 [Arthrobacter sp. StoSoilB19]|nr:hypothetical protein StoSoilB19_34000 [Arthrobacter sp. StoSoilB19]
MRVRNEELHQPALEAGVVMMPVVVVVVVVVVVLVAAVVRPVRVAVGVR